MPSVAGSSLLKKNFSLRRNLPISSVRTHSILLGHRFLLMLLKGAGSIVMGNGIIGGSHFGWVLENFGSKYRRLYRVCIVWISRFLISCFHLNGWMLGYPAGLFSNATFVSWGSRSKWVLLVD